MTSANSEDRQLVDRSVPAQVTNARAACRAGIRTASQIPRRHARKLDATPLGPRWFSCSLGEAMRSSALVLLVVCLGLASCAARAATCEHPTTPSADQNPSAFLALFLADTDLRDLFPLCGHPKIAVVGPATLFGPVTYTFDKEGRPLSRDMGGLVTDKYMYDSAGRLVEIRTVTHEGDITGRRVFTWSSPYEYTATTLDEDGTPEGTRAHGVLDLAARTITIRGGNLSVVHKFDANWNNVGLQDGRMSFVTERDAKGRQQFEWRSTATGAKQPMTRYHYSGSDEKGNPTMLLEEVAVMQYGVVGWKPGEKKAVRVVEYW